MKTKEDNPLTLPAPGAAVRGSGERLVFLDIDGVLVNRRSLKERSGLRAVGDPACVAALNHITEQTGARLVLSSAWRFCGLEEMRLILRHWGVAADLIDCTPDLTRRAISTGLYEGAARGREIQVWLDENWTPESFVIIDDDCDMEHLGSRLVRTEFEPGLTMANARRAIEMLAPLQPRENPREHDSSTQGYPASVDSGVGGQ